jgi:hypothetical protein
MAGLTHPQECVFRCLHQSKLTTVQRGIHDIEEELVFRSNPGFVFHDSPGIEAGATNEMQAIQDFISKRATARSLSEKLHAIWYCIPTDNTRLVAAAELQFFDQIDPNGVPVILIFTKFESQEAVAFAKLQETYSLDDALARAPQQARQEFEQDHLSRFKNRKYPPKEIIYLKNMDKGDAECSEIIELTTRALNNDTLKWLLATVQEVNLKFRVEQMLRSKFLFEPFMTNEIIHMEKKTYMKLARAVWIWFPHLWRLDDNFDFDHFDFLDNFDDNFLDRVFSVMCIFFLYPFLLNFFLASLSGCKYNNCHFASHFKAISLVKSYSIISICSQHQQ